VERSILGRGPELLVNRLRPSNPIIVFVTRALAFLLTAVAMSIVGYELGLREKAPIHRYGFPHAAAMHPAGRSRELALNPAVADNQTISGSV
jgi:hypothetical protein